jgi:O-antigen/teichoic acid export membrane protein
MVWNAASMVATRLGGIAAQIVLGWVLTKDDFALFGVAVLIIGIGQSVHNGGIRPVLVQRPDQFASLASAGFRYASIVAVATMLALGACAPGLTTLLDRPGLTTLLWIGAVSFPLQIPPLIYQAKLAVEMRFQSSAAVMVCSGAARSGAMIASALGGLGAASFVIPYASTAALEWPLLRKVAGALPSGVPLDRGRFWEFARNGRWLSLSTLGSTLALHGEKLLVDRLTPGLLGTYFFGSQLVLGVTNLLQAGFGNVLLPTFARMGGDRQRQVSAYLRSVRAFGLLGAPACVALAVLSPALLHLVWQGKWDDATPVVQCLSIALFSWVLGQLSLQMVSALGAWRVHAALVGLDAVTLMGAAAVGARSGDLTQLALWVSAQRLCWGFVQVTTTARLLGVGWRKTCASIAVPASAGVGAGIVTCAVTNGYLQSEHSLASLVGTASIYIIGFVVLSGLFLRTDVENFLSLLRSARGHVHGSQN